jgi:TIR domain
MPYRFFFSYARETYKASQIGGKNLLDQFFEDLSSQVALEAGERIEEVGYRDVDRLRISDDWGPDLIAGMQDSAVLLCVISPHYLKSLPCGREFGLFQERLALSEGPPKERKNRVLPVFWIGEPSCHHAMLPHVKDFVRSMQLMQKGLPNDYPLVGLSDFYGQQDGVACYKFRKRLAERILELSNLPILPKLQNPAQFGKLVSFFEPRRSFGDEQVAEGPRGTNIVYAVATRDLAGEAKIETRYGEKSEDWKPFKDKPNRTIDLLTQNALRDADQDATQYKVISLSEELVAKLKKAKRENSPVIMVLDRTSLQFESIRKHVLEYDAYDAPHVGLITAGGTAADEPLLAETFAAKYRGRRRHYLWTVPPTSDAYELSVAHLVSALRSNLLKTSRPKVRLRSSTMPTLTQPGA